MERMGYALWAVLTFSLFALTGCNAGPSTSIASNAPAFSAPTGLPLTPKSVYGWKQLANETLEFQPLHSQQFNLPSASKLRVSVHADSGVFGGVFDRQNTTAKILRERQFRASACSLVAVIQGEAICKVNSASKLVYVLRDKRSEAALAGGLILARQGDTKTLRRATAPNRVAIKIDVWECVANCQTSTSLN